MGEIKKSPLPQNHNDTQSCSIIADFLPVGAIVHSFRVDGINIVQNFGTPEEYRDFNVPYFGETIGRVANRIKDGKIQDLNGHAYDLAVNNGKNCLHGGLVGWGKKEWKQCSSFYDDDAGKRVVRWKYQSVDGEEGFPGTVDATVTYAEGIEIGSNGEEISVLEMEYEAELVDGAEETVVAMTNHSYFNLTAANTAATIDKTQVSLSTDLHLPVDKDLIPTGAIEPYPGGFTSSTFNLGPEEPDIDHCFILNDSPATVGLDTRSQASQKLASFYHPDSKINLEVWSTEPAFQFYTGKFIDVEAVGDIPARGPRTGFCVEPSRYINAVNVDDWKNMVVLRIGQKYGSRSCYRAWKSQG